MAQVAEVLSVTREVAIEEVAVLEVAVVVDN